MRRVLVIVVVALTLVAGAVASVRHDPNPIRVTLTAESHQPHPSNDPSWQWGYCVRITTAAGKSVASSIHLQILEGTKRAAGLGSVSLKKGYDHWCAAVGGEANALLGLPRGKKLVFQAVVKANGMTVRRNWPFVVH